MVGKLAKTLGFLGAFGAGIAGYNEADAQQLYHQVPEQQIKNLSTDLKNRINNLGKKNLEIMTVDEYRKLPTSEIPRYESFVWTSPDGKELGPSLYASKDIWKSLAPEDKLYLKRAAVEPIGYLVLKNMNERKPVYDIGGYLYLGPAESVPEAKSQPTQQKPKAKYLPKPKAKSKKPVKTQRQDKKPSRLEEEAKKAGERKDTLKAAAETKYEEKKFAVQEEEPFYVMKDDSLYLLKPYEQLSATQQADWLMKLGNFGRDQKLIKVKSGMYVAAPDTSKTLEDSLKTDVTDEEISELRTRFGLEFGPRAAVSINGEVTGEIFLNYPIWGDLRLGGFLGWSAIKGKNYFENQSSEYERITKSTKNISPTRTEARIDEKFDLNSSNTEP